MEKIFEDENHNYQIDLSQAVWASDRLNSIYHESKIELSDVDFIAETENDLLFIEYKMLQSLMQVTLLVFNLI